MSGLCVDTAEGQLSCPGQASAQGPGEGCLGGGGCSDTLCGLEQAKREERTLGAPCLERALHPTPSIEGTRFSISPSYKLLTPQGGDRSIPVTEGGQNWAGQGLFPRPKTKVRWVQETAPHLA